MILKSVPAYIYFPSVFLCIIFMCTCVPDQCGDPITNQLILCQCSPATAVWGGPWQMAARQCFPIPGSVVLTNPPPPPSLSPSSMLPPALPCFLPSLCLSFVPFPVFTSSGVAVLSASSSLRNYSVWGNHQSSSSSHLPRHPHTHTTCTHPHHRPMDWGAWVTSMLRITCACVAHATVVTIK